jgi:hypothetical protein
MSNHLPKGEIAPAGLRWVPRAGLHIALVALIIGLAVHPLAACLFTADVGGPGSTAQVVRYQMSRIAAVLGSKNLEATDADSLIFHPIRGKDAGAACRTNRQGELVDVWGTPYQIKIESPSKFVIRSAGADGQFGDADDIVYDSSQHGFVNP